MTVCYAFPPQPPPTHASPKPPPTYPTPPHTPPTKPHPTTPPVTIESRYEEVLENGVIRWGFLNSDGSGQDVIMTPIPGEEGGVTYIQEGRWYYYGKYTNF